MLFVCRKPGKRPLSTENSSCFFGFEHSRVLHLVYIESAIRSIPVTFFTKNVQYTIQASKVHSMYLTTKCRGSTFCALSTDGRRTSAVSRSTRCPIAFYTAVASGWKHAFCFDGGHLNRTTIMLSVNKRKPCGVKCLQRELGRCSQEQ